MHTDIQGNSLLSGFTVLGFPFQELQRSSQAFLVCLFYSRNTNIYDSARSLILLLTSSYWLTMFFQKLKRDLSYSKAFACGNKHCCFPAASSAATQLPFKPSVMRSVCRKSMLNARALSFLLTFCSLSQHLEFKCFNQCPGSALFSWKMVFSSRSLQYLQNHKWFLHKRWEAKLFCLMLGQEEAQTNAAQLHKMN